MDAANAGFSPEHLQALITKINKNPALLEQDWREVVRSHFRLSPEQEKSLTDLSPEKVKHIQDFLTTTVSHLRQAGTVTGELVKRPPQEQTHLVYDVDIELAPKVPPRPKA